jgi:hypothetical protein
MRIQVYPHNACPYPWPMPKEVINTMENINCAQPVRNEELQHAPNRPSLVFLSLGEGGSGVGVF